MDPDNGEPSRSNLTLLLTLDVALTLTLTLMVTTMVMAVIITIVNHIQTVTMVNMTGTLLSYDASYCSYCSSSE